MAVLQARQGPGSRPAPVVPAVLLLVIAGGLAWQLLDAKGDRPSSSAIPASGTVRRSNTWEVPANLSMAVQLPGWWMQSCEEPPCTFASLEEGAPTEGVSAVGRGGALP